MQGFAAKARVADAARGAPVTRAPQRAPAVRQILRAPAVQAKLEIGATNDPAEHEADRIADRVMRMPGSGAASGGAMPPSSGGRPIVRRTCAACAGEDEIRRRADGTGAAGPAPGIVGQVLRAPGQPLDAVSRTFFEPRFGYDFSDVRVHTGAQASASARAIGALAYAAGDNIVFGEGQYAPGAAQGRHLLAHELAHVTQQGSAQPGAAPLRRLGDPSKIPAGLGCAAATGSAPSFDEVVLFGDRVTDLSAANRTKIDNFIARWRMAGANRQVRIDGYASTRDTDALNWRLSCNRALAVKAELERPLSGAPGIPSSFLKYVMQGETTEFGPEESNRRSTISMGPARAAALPTPEEQIDHYISRLIPDRVPLPDKPCPAGANTAPGFCEKVSSTRALLERAVSGDAVVAGAALAGGMGMGIAGYLFYKFVYGGSRKFEDISSGAPLFTRDQSTRFSTDYMLWQYLAAIYAGRERVFDHFSHHPSTSLRFEVTPDQHMAVDDEDSPYTLSFCDIPSLPGVIAGGVGKTQITERKGADTSAAQNDFRDVNGRFDVAGHPQAHNSNAIEIEVAPRLMYTVIDTLDFCPGNAGSELAQNLTIPLSRWEASGISGDVTFGLFFPAPARRGRMTLRRANGATVADNLRVE